MNPKPVRIPTGTAILHGLGAIAYGVKDNGFSSFLLIFCNQVLGMDSTLVSLALLVALVMDGLADPAIGYLSDRTRSRWGRRLPWLYLAPLPLAVAWAGLWSLSTAPGFAELVVLAVTIRLLVSCCEVPSVSLVAELTQDYDERSRLLRYRYLFAWAGGLLIMMLAYTVFLRGGLQDARGYATYGTVGAALIAVSVVGSALGQHRLIVALPSRPRMPISARGALNDIAECFSHPAFRILLLAGAVAFTSQGATFAVANYMFLFVWRFPAAWLQAYPLVLFVSVLVTFVAVGPAHRRWGKRDTGVVSALGAMTLWVIPYILRHCDLWPQAGTTPSTLGIFFFAFCSNALGVVTMISLSSMVADVVEASQVITGRRDEGVFAAGFFFVQKCATGLGIFTTGLLVSWAGIPQKAAPASVGAQAVDRLGMGYSTIVAVLAIVLALVLRRFPIDRADHQARVAALTAAARLDLDAAGMHP